MPRLSIDDHEINVQLHEGETIAAGLVRLGYAQRIGCRRGGCAICKVDVLDGQVVHNRPVAGEVLSADELAGGACLTCRAVPVTDIRIRLRHGDRIRTVNPLIARLARQQAG